ncbi:hypothetical protein PsorP6_017193 [Peronosclerospora sorghi]|uniref:Uncharacterized protein n=1 Tax=Peronosclerospora sorghi TaxID=230839 RepID=A0ACC0WE21_9STRA|nr:hypothetical protein PsorP6_017193 [Peronosclerospora sorghi]
MVNACGMTSFVKAGSPLHTTKEGYQIRASAFWTECLRHEMLAFVVIGASMQKVAHNASEKYKEGKFILELAKTDQPP